MDIVQKYMTEHPTALNDAGDYVLEHSYGFGVSLALAALLYTTP
ncbi:MAG: hypothetical protein U9O53_06795 [archaeon]|nr:hypothetical protein [archaeon]